MSLSMPLLVVEHYSKRLPYSLGFNKFALSFDGDNDYVTVADHATLDITDAGSVEVLFKNPDPTSDGTLITKGNAGTHKSNNYDLWVSGGAFAAGIGDGSSSNTISSAALTENTLYHALFTWDGSFLNLYINNVPVTSVAQTITPAANNNSFTISRTAVTFIEGEVYYVRVYKDKALTQEEGLYNMLNYHTPIMDNLSLWLDLEEGSGTTVFDRSGNGNDGTFGATPADPTWVKRELWEARALIGL